MKRHICLVLFLLLFFNISNSQRIYSGMKTFQINTGFVNNYKYGWENDKAFFSGISYSSYSHNGNKFSVGFEYLQKGKEYEKEYFPVSSITIDCGYYFNLISDPSKTYFLNFGILALAGYETINWGNNILYDGAKIENEDSFIYGGSLVIENDFFISDKFILSVFAKEKISLDSSVNKFHLLFGMGLRYVF